MTQRGARAAYRGPDRRRGVNAPVDLSRLWRSAGILVLLAIAGAGALVLGGLLDQAVATALPTLRAASLAVGVVLAITSYMTWRATGELAGLYVAVFAVMLVGAGSVNVATASLSLTDLEAAFRTACSLVAARYLVAALWGPEIDSWASPIREGARAVSRAVGLFVVLLIVLELSPGRLQEWVLPALLAVPWLFLGAVGSLQATERRSYLLAWVPWSTLGLALAELARAVSVVDTPSWSIVGVSVRLAGLSVAALGATVGLGRAVRRGRDEVFRAELLGRARTQEMMQSSAERSHEIRNALIAIEGASLTLQRHQVNLDESTVRQLERAVLAGIGNLRALVLPGDGGVAPGGRFDLLEVLNEQMLLARGSGLPVILDWSGNEKTIEVSGNRSATSQIITNLLTNARRHGRAGDESPVVIRVGLVGRRALVKVMDRGPGVPAEYTDVVFERGVQVGNDDTGEGLGLPVARHLARAQGGELTCETRDRGACFVLSLRLAGEVDDAVPATEPADERADRR